MSHRITKSIIVQGEPEHLYNLWSDFENFPRFMKHIKSVKKQDDRTSRWTMEGPLGILITWNVETTMLEKNKRIAWSSKDKDGDIKTSGQVTFNPLSHGQSEVTVTLQYSLPAGSVGETLADLLANPEQGLSDDLRNFKAYAERIPERTGSPAG